MAITRNDCLLLLTELQNQGTKVDDEITQLMSSRELPINVLKFINDSKPLDVVEFYDMVRVNGNKKKSNLYKNIVKEIEEPQEVLTTLAALNLQILLYGKKLQNKRRFYSHVRAEEITKVLDNYYRTYDLTNCINLLKLFKADIKCLESIKK